MVKEKGELHYQKRSDIQNLPVIVRRYYQLNVSSMSKKLKSCTLKEHFAAPFNYHKEK